MTQKRFATRLGAFALFFALLVGLSACSQEQLITAHPDRVLEFDICPEALALPDSQRGFQGRQGWFFFNFDFRETYKTITPEQAAFVVRLNQALMTQGVRLVVVPVPARGAVRPSVLYLNDPKQAAFSPAAIVAYYDAYIETLRQNGVAAVNVLAEAIAFDASGGQTFFKRDLHWTPEGANIVAQATAQEIQKRLGKPLTETRLVLARNPHNQTHPGRFINNWLYSSCNTTLPPEPLGDYAVSRPSGFVQKAEVVQAGSSFGGTPFDQGFLGVALQSEVSNVSVGNGGALFALESYLGGRDYQTERPRVLVWEFPAASSALGAAAQRRLLAGVYGTCTGKAVQFQQTAAANKTLVLTQPAGASDHYLTFSFDDLSVIHFSAVLHYQDGSSETLAFDRPEQTAARNEGRYFTTLTAAPTALKAIELTLPETATGNVTVQVCRTPDRKKARPPKSP